MSDHLIVITKSELQEIIRKEMDAVMTAFVSHNLTTKKEEKPLIYRTRKYVKELLHTSYPTLDKYSDPDTGILKVHYFGRKKLYLEDELNLALPIVKDLIKKKKVA